MKPIIQIFIIAFLVSCNVNYPFNQKSKKTDSPLALNKTFKSDTGLWLLSKNISVLSFLDLILSNNENGVLNLLTIEDSFPSNWIKTSDIDTLIKLVDSKTKCKCLVSPLSSYLPVNDSADLGGYAIKLINSFRKEENIHYLYICPKTDKKDAEDVQKWWAKKILSSGR